MQDKYTVGGGYAQGCYSNPRKWYLADLYVMVEHRRQGLATELMRQVCEDADREGVYVELEAVPDDIGPSYTELVCFYEKFGFRLNDYAAVMMRKPLTPAR